MNLANGTIERSLPQLSGGLLWSYRLAWCALAIGAVLTSGLSIHQSAHAPAVLGLRLAKGAVLVSVATILLYRRLRDPVAALLALAFLTWTITSSTDFGGDAKFVQLLDRCRFLLLALALLLFPDGRWNPRWTRKAAAASAVAFLIGVSEALRLLPTRLFLPLAVPCVLAGIASLMARFRVSMDYALKQQLKWVALGLVAGVGLILIARIGDAALTPDFKAMPVLWEAIFQLGIIIVALGFLVSLLRFRLFDAESVISRSAAYAALTVIVVATFGGTEAAIENVGQQYLGMNVGNISGAMAAAVAALLLNPLHGRISDWAEDRFQPDLAKLKREVPELLVRVGSSRSTRHLCREVLPRINAAIHATRSAVLVNGRIIAASGTTVREAYRWSMHPTGKDYEWTKGNDPLFALRLALGGTGSAAAAWLLLGPRPDGTLYGREDRDAVRSILPALHNALITAAAREAQEAAIDRREKQLLIEIQRIHARLDAIQAHSP